MPIFLDGSGLCGEVGWELVTRKEDYGGSTQAVWLYPQMTPDDGGWLGGIGLRVDGDGLVGCERGGWGRGVG